MFLVVDIGNTALKAAWVENGIFGKTFRYQGEKPIGFIEKLVAEGVKKPSVLVVSSVKPVSQVHAERLEKCCEKLVLVDPNNLELRRKMGVPEWLSSDRCASVSAARSLFNNRACTIIDLGNTITTDFLAESGEYLGGNVTLGCVSRYKALNRYAKNMPFLAIPDEAPAKFGKIFEESIHSGIVNGIVAELESQIAVCPGNAVIVTGADSNYFVKRLKNSIFAISNLVLIGLVQFANEANV